MVNPSGSRQRSPRSQKPYISSEHSEQNSKRQSRQNVPNSTSGSIVRYKKTESNFHFNLLKAIKKMHLTFIKWLWTGVDSHFQWSVDQLMHDQEHGRRCFLCPLFCVAIHVAQIYSGFFHPTPWCITSRCISCSPCRLVIEGPYIANQSNKKTRGLRRKKTFKIFQKLICPRKDFLTRFS